MFTYKIIFWLYVHILICYEYLQESCICIAKGFKINFKKEERETVQCILESESLVSVQNLKIYCPGHLEVNA